MADKMSLREAVEMCDDFARHSGHPEFEASAAEMERWDRARAIVDAAVLFVEARKDLGAWSTNHDWKAAEVAEWKLRALERGEDV